jgi:ankyrin repeat protein
MTRLSLGIDILLQRDPGLLEARDDMGNTPLLFMAVDSFQPGHYYVRRTHVESLLKAGADPTVCDVNGMTVLMKTIALRSPIQDDMKTNGMLQRFIRATFSQTRIIEVASSASHSNTTTCDSPDE